jgi:AAA domain/Bifunctional DNA primase/polymerase, N-terminal/Primase C terminal 2 (PriCT-2)
MGAPDITCGPKADAIRSFRKRCIEHGYKPIPVRSQSKQPFGKQWQQGVQEDQLLIVEARALNTGILAAGLRCFDVDVDDRHVADLVERRIRQRYPTAIVRRRANSPRVTIVTRAAKDQPGKRSVGGPTSKLEVLGVGQQFVAHGVHPSGDTYEWESGRGPDTVPINHLPAATEEQVNELLNECAPLLGSPNSAGGPAAISNGFDQPLAMPEFGKPSDLFNGLPIENDLAAGIERNNWFSSLQAEKKADLVQACLNRLDNRTADPRDTWIRVLFAVADADQLGCPDARRLARDWSQRGASWTGERDFETAYDSSKSQPGKITVGSLLKMAHDAGLDLSPWRDLALAQLQPASAEVQEPATSSGTVIDPYGFITLALENVPPHRQWSVGTKLIKGEVSVLAAKGGWGKSAYATTLLCSAASGDEFLNEVVWGGPKQCLYINSEDDTDELQRKFIAAVRHHNLTRAQLQNIMIRGVNTPGHETLTTGDDSAPRVNEAGITALDQIITRACAEIVILDPLGTFCPAGLNDNGVMGQVMLRLKRLAKKHNCAVLVVHHTRKDGDLTNVDAIGGASAIVNQARVALMLARMSAEESKNFKGVLPSEVWRYFRIVDAKTNLAPPASSTQWYQLVSHELPNAAPPTYTKGDGVQVVDKLDPAKLSASPLGSVADDIAKRAILKAASSADPPFSPSGKGGSERYIVRQVLGTVRHATDKHLAERDLLKHVEVLVEEMMALGWLYVADVKVAGNKRKGVMVNWAVTPWAREFTGDCPAQGSSDSARQIRQKPFEAIRRTGTGGIDAPRPTGASNVPKGCGDLTGQVFDAAPTDADPTTELPPSTSSAKNGAMGSEQANRTSLDEILAQDADRLGIPKDLLRRGSRPSTIKQSDHQTTLRSLANKSDHRDRSE